MFYKVCIIFAGALFAIMIQAKTYAAELILSDDATIEGTLLWQPVSEGLTRYQLSLPQRGISDAIKYQDTSALYYLSQRSDAGFQLAARQDDRIDLLFTSDHTSATYIQSLTPALAYHLGINFYTDSRRNEALIGASWRTVTGHTRLDQITTALHGREIIFSWARSELSNNERAERLYFISNNAGDLQAFYGVRWFDLFNSTDLLSEVGIDDDALVIGVQFERGLGSANGFIGAVSNLDSDDIHLTMGARYTFGTRAKVHATTNIGLTSRNVQSLKALRNAALPSHWRNSVSLKPSGILGDAPEKISTFSTLD